MDRRLKILQSLSQNEYVTNAELAEKLGLSKRTIYNELDALNEELERNGARIFSKPHYGVMIEIEDEDKYKKYLSSLKEDPFSVENADSRVLQITNRLIESVTPIKMDDLCEELYISRSTLNHDMKKVKQFLKRYDLKIESSAYKGSYIVGSENNVRKALADVNKQLSGASNQAVNEDMKKIAAILRKVFAKQGIRVPEYLFNNLVIHFYIAVTRIKLGFSMKEAEGYEQFSNEEERNTAIEIIKEIEKEFAVTFPESEISYVTLNLKSRQLSDEKGNSVISKEIYEMVMEMLDEIDQMFHYDFKYDLELVSLLASHLASLEVRLLYDMTLDNPLIEQIREGSLLAFEMANVACSKLVKKYHKKISADEMAYIALHFHLAIERKKDRQKKNVLIVCGTGRGSAELLAYNIRRNYGKELNVVGTHESSDFTGVDFSKYDYVLTTIHIEETIPIPIIEISMIYDRKDDEKLNEYLSYNSQSRMLEFFDEDLFCPHMTGNSKEEILQQLCQKAVDKGLVSGNFYHHVLKREELGPTAFGNGIAIPHPYRPEGEKSFVVTGLLDEPIDWDSEPVQVVFLLSMAAKGDKSLQSFYRSVGKLLASKSCVNQLLTDQRFENLISILDTLEE